MAELGLELNPPVFFSAGSTAQNTEPDLRGSFLNLGCIREKLILICNGYLRVLGLNSLVKARKTVK